MKNAKIFLWLQVVIGLVGLFVSFSYIHWGAMSVAWGHGLRNEHARLQESGSYQEPSKIRDQSLSEILADLEA